MDSAQEEAAETDEASLARATAQAREIVESRLVDRWIALARQNEGQPGQIDRLLHDLGEMPTEPVSELAFWLGALVNPQPGLGVAREIRPSLLMARTAEERILVALQGITESIQHMEGSKRLF